MTQRVVVTGAGSGLGKALALNYAAKGCEVCVSDMDRAAGEAVVAEITARQQKAFFVPCDITQDADVDALATQLKQHWGAIDVLINNAGVATAGSLEYEDIAQWQWVMNINLFGMVRVSRALIGLLRSASASGQQATLINIASQAGITPIPMMASYNAAKAAVVSFSETMRLELARDNISVSVACPSFFATNLDKSLRSNQPGVDKVVKKLLTRNSISADEVAATIVTQAHQQRFLILTHKDGRMAYWLKRLLPASVYLNKVIKQTRHFGTPRDTKR